MDKINEVILYAARECKDAVKAPEIAEEWFVEIIGQRLGPLLATGLEYRNLTAYYATLDQAWDDALDAASVE